MKELVIREFREADHDVVVDLHYRALSQINAAVSAGVIEDLDKDFDDIDGVYTNNRGFFLIGEVDDRIVAMGAFKYIGKSTCEIKRMRVEPNYQGRGFGRQMLQELERRALEMGYTIAKLDTGLNQRVAQKLYESAGYKRVEETILLGRPALVYQKQLK